MNEAVITFLRDDLKFAVRSLARTKGLTLTVVLTLALGIGANSAMFSVVRGVLLRPLANRDENRLIYIRQSARGIGAENAAFSVPEIHDLRERREIAERVRRFLHHRLHHGRPRRAARGPGGRRGRIVFRRDGTASGARPSAGSARRWPERRRRGRADLPLLDGCAQERSHRARQDHPAERRARRPSWACWSRRYRIRRKPNSSPT